MLHHTSISEEKVTQEDESITRRMDMYYRVYIYIDTYIYIYQCKPEDEGANKYMCHLSLLFQSPDIFSS